MARTADKRRIMLREIRRKIIAGEFPPGSRLPARSEFESVYQASPTTVQRVFDGLRAEGFIVVRGRYATHVAERPPHLFRYAIAFPEQPSSDPSRWPRSWNALVAAAARLNATGSCTIELFHGIREASRHEHYRRLIQAAETRCLAGLIFANRPWADFGVNNPLLLTTGIPRVSTCPNATGPANIPAIVRDYNLFFDRAIDRLLRHQCRRIAVFLTPERYKSHGAYINRALATRGIPSRPYWLQVVHPAAAEAARLNVQLLLGPEQTLSPDGLVIADDNLVDAVKAGLMDVGMTDEHRLRVVAHGAFPSPPDATLPVIRLGFDARTVLQQCLDNLARQQRGEPVPPVTRIAPVFEDELPLTTPRAYGYPSIGGPPEPWRTGPPEEASEMLPYDDG